MKLDLYRTVCLECKRVFETLNWPTSAWGPIFFATQGGGAGLLDPDADSFWATVVALAPSERGWHWPYARYRPHDGVAEAAVDAAPGGEKWYIWGMVPCPNCGSRDALSDDPHDPPRVTEVEPIEVQHRCWDKLSDLERRKLVDRVVASRPPCWGQASERLS